MGKFLAVLLVLVIPGVFILMYHVRLLSGQGNKSFYMADHIYAGRVYAGIPGGIAIIVVATVR